MTDLETLVRANLKLLSICKADDGAILFERSWKWLAGHDSKRVGHLVRSFFQVAKQLDHGMVSRVVFESSSSSSSEDVDRSEGDPASLHTGRMQLLCTRNEKVVVSLFYEFQDVEYEEPLHAAMRQFVEQARELWTQKDSANLEKTQRNTEENFHKTLDLLLEQTLKLLSQ